MRLPAVCHWIAWQVPLLVTDDAQQLPLLPCRAEGCLLHHVACCCPSLAVDFVQLYSSRQGASSKTERLGHQLPRIDGKPWDAESAVYKGGITRCATTQVCRGYGQEPPSGALHSMQLTVSWDQRCRCVGADALLQGAALLLCSHALSPLHSCSEVTCGFRSVLAAAV